jgi:lambda family phage portal protein
MTKTLAKRRTTPKPDPRSAQTPGRAPKPGRAVAFEAGKTGRRLKAIPTSGVAINTLIRTYGRNVVARSRYLAANNPYASAAKEAYVSALVGGGIKPSPLYTGGGQELKTTILRTWKAWTDESDADGITDFYGLQTIVAQEMFEAGECFVRLRARLAVDGLTVPLQLQLLPSEMLDTSHNESLPNGGKIECGIEFGPIGNRVAYWFWKNHPGELISGMNIASAMAGGMKTRVPAEEVLHLFKPIRAGQIRGLPHTIAGIVTLAMVDLYDDAELERKRIAALFAAFITREKGSNSDEIDPFEGATEFEHVGGSGTGADVVSDFSLEPGAVIDLAEGQGVEFAEPADVGATYESFQYRNLLRAAAGFGVPYSDMTGDLRQTSYGSIRAGLVAFRRRIEAQQHQVMVFQFCRPIWNRWLPDAILTGAIKGLKASTYQADPLLVREVKWIPPKWEWIDPLKDRQAEKLAVDSGFKSRSDVIEAEGYDPEEIDSRIKTDQDRASELGISFIKLASSVIVSPDEEGDDSFSEDPAASDTMDGEPDDGDPADFGDFEFG